MTDSDKNSSNTSQKIRNKRWETQRNRTRRFSGTSERKANKNGIKTRHITASITQITQITDKLMDLICRYGK